MATLLRSGNFRFLWLGQLCSQFGDRLTQLVLVALVATHSSGSTLSLAKVLVVTSLPALLVNPFAGAYVDRWDRKRTMMVCDFIRAVVIASLPWVAMAQSHLPLYAAVFTLFAVAAFFVPARLAMIPDLVPPEQLSKANALFTSSGMIGATVIVLVGALMVEWIGAYRSCWVNAASYLASAAFIAPILLKKKTVSAYGESAGRILHEIAEGIQALWKNKRTRRVAGFLALLMAGAGASVVVATVMVQKALGTVTKDLGFLSLWIGVGMLVGTLGYGRWGTHWSRRRVLGLAFLGCGFSLWAFIGAIVGLKSGAAASATTALLGISLAPVGIITNTLVHEGHPERLHGRIFSSLGVVINLALIISMLAAGWLVERGGRGLLLAAVGGFFALGGIGILIRFRSRSRP